MQARLVSNRSDIFRQFERVSNNLILSGSSTRFGIARLVSGILSFSSAPILSGGSALRSLFEQLDVSGSPDKVG